MAAHPQRRQEHFEPGEAIRRRVAGFLRTLRDNGFKIGLAESRDLLTILSAVGLMRRSQAREAMKSLLCSRRSDWDQFDDLFDAYWFGRAVKTRARLSGPAPGGAQVQKNLLGGQTLANDAGAVVDLDAGAGGESDASPLGKREGASRFDSFARTDFRKIADPEAMAKAHALAERLARVMRSRITRRDRPKRRGTRIDLRRTIRASLPTGGTPLALVRSRKHHKPLRLVVLVDVSGSMNLYTSVFLRFVHGILDHFLEADAFLFHTRLVHVSDALREKDAGRALDRLGLMAEGAGGGTKIGDSLATFNRWHAARVIHSRTCVMILSDGYDTGEPAQLAAGMAALRRRCKRIVWLNPLIGWEGYEPSARGMAAALPFIDLFAPAHTLESLAALEPYLARI